MISFKSNAVFAQNQKNKNMNLGFVTRQILGDFLSYFEQFSSQAIICTESIAKCRLTKLNCGEKRGEKKLSKLITERLKEGWW